MTYIHNHQMLQLSPAPCGCQLEHCATCGVKHSIIKCDHHTPGRISGPALYLKGMHNHDSRGIPRHRDICKELTGVLDSIDLRIPEARNFRDRALDIGAGTGIYAPLLMNLGYTYTPLEPDPWASAYTEGGYADVIRSPFLSTEFPEKFSFIMCAHVLEHLDAPDRAIERIHEILLPDCDVVFIIPDDRDLFNPDHLWFFNRGTFLSWVEEAGFTVMGSAVHPAEREDFIYVYAKKGSHD